MNVRSMCAVFGAPYARASGGRRGLAALAGAIFALAAGMAHVQADENQLLDAGAVSAILRNDGLVLGIEYENTFGRRLANSVGLLFDHESVLKNLPIPAYPMNLLQDKICNSEGGPPGGDIGEKIAIVRAAERPERPDRYIGLKFVPGGSNATIELRHLCDWLDEPDAWRAYSELHVFDVMGRKGKWVALEVGPPPSGVKRIMRGSAFGAPQGESAAWWNVGAGDGDWTLTWGRLEVEDNVTPPAFANDAWWVYQPDNRPVDTPRDEYPVYLSFPDQLGDERKSATVSSCGIDLSLGWGWVGCDMTWSKPPALPDDPSKEFSLWAALDESAAPTDSRDWIDSRDWDDWYLLTQRLLQPEEAKLFIERAAFR